MKRFSAFLVAICFLLDCYGQKKISVSSPNGNIAFHFSVIHERPVWSAVFNGRSVIENSEISFSFDNHLARISRMQKPTLRKGTDDYTLLVGKVSSVHEEYREMIIPLEDASGTVAIHVVVRAFNQGIAFRYEFLKTGRNDSLILTDENTQFRFNGDPVIHSLSLPNYTSSHEGFYNRSRTKELKEGVLLDLPVLVELPGSIFAAVTEASLVDYAGLYLTVKNSKLRATLSPLPGQTLVKVKAILPHKSPWRVLLLGDRPGSLIESTIITSLNEPCALGDVSWIKPGKTTFPWWNGNVVPDTLNAPGNNFVTQKYYIDFCARQGIEYHSVVEYGLHQWYVDDGVGFQPGPHSDPTRAVPGLDMKEVCDYARSKGVGVRVWVHWAALYPKLDEAFTNYEKWGLQGMMIDFMDRDDQLMVNMQNEMLRKAAAHHLHVQFHGAYKPTGMHRTYPNEFTREGTLNYEINKWDPNGLPPEQDVMIPFTRMIAGSTDYHLGGFRAVTKEQFVTQYTRPLVLGTRSHMLAMYVVLENYLGMVCDYPVAYEGQPGFDFIRTVPTVWDETRVLDAKVGQYIVIARRKKARWFIGAITNNEPRTLALALRFLDGKSIATLYEDAEDSMDQPNHVKSRTQEVDPSGVLTLKLVGGGGAAIQIREH